MSLFKRNPNACPYCGTSFNIIQRFLGAKRKCESACLSKKILPNPCDEPIEPEVYITPSALVELVEQRVWDGDLEEDFKNDRK